MPWITRIGRGARLPTTVSGSQPSAITLGTTGASQGAEARAAARKLGNVDSATTARTAGRREAATTAIAPPRL